MVDIKGIVTDSLYTALFEFSVQTEKTYYQGQTQVGNRHVNCLERFQSPRGNVTLVFWHTRYIYANVLGNLIPCVLEGAT
jgi:hypothetical protein